MLLFIIGNNVFFFTAWPTIHTIFLILGDVSPYIFLILASRLIWDEGTKNVISSCNLLPITHILSYKTINIIKFYWPFCAFSYDILTFFMCS